ncbi:MAG: DUF2892 domain-containing protein [Thalassovita sp.]|nr:DUF2892 domain-containing protein [Thalassovita sp.]
MFAKNVGTIDKVLRIIIGALLIIGGLMGSGVWMWIGVIVGVILLVTGLMGSCPIYSATGMRTNPAENE